MTIPEGRLAVRADAAVVLAAQHETAQAINIDPWTQAQLAGMARNANLPRGQWGFIVAPTAADGSVEGFMLTRRDRDGADPTGASDATEIIVQLICSRVLHDGQDRPRLRRVVISTFKLLTRICHARRWTWYADFPPVVGAAIAAILAEFAALIPITSETLADGWTRARSEPVVSDPDTLNWGDA